MHPKLELKKYPALRDYREVLMLLVWALLLTSLGLLIEPRKTVTPDTANYSLMAQGQYQHATTPFRYRPVVPWLAGQLPFPPLEALRLITCLAIFVVFILFGIECLMFELTHSAFTLSLFLVFCSRPILFNYFHPYLTDGLGILALTVLALLFLSDRALLFATFLSIAVFIRESALFVVPAWLFSRRWNHFVWLAALGFALFVIPRIYLPSNIHYQDYVEHGVQTKATHFWILPFVKGLLLSWQGLWLLGIYGLLDAPERLKTLSYALSIGGVISCLVIGAGDYERMLSVLAPALAPAIAFTIQRAARSAQVILACSGAFQFCFGNPYVFQGLAHSHYQILLIASTIISYATSLWVIATISRSRPRLNSLPLNASHLLALRPQRRN